ncbi:MAG: glycosyltransferase family 4 protein [Epsilonproteobacteria bacterium]|nr:glycosyltransferase family 4 protein [Campylobacterota bacterium]
MNIWILNHHAVTPQMSGGTRHYDFAKALVKRGHQVTIIASSFHYAKLKEMKEYSHNQDYLQETIDGVTFLWFKTPPYQSNGVKRVVNMLSYTKKALQFVPKILKEKPDVIIGSSVHLFAVYAAQRLANKYHIPFVMEVRDLWPQTLIDMGMSKWHPFIMLLAFMEKFLYQKADKIITLLPQAEHYITTLGVEKSKIVWVSNGVELSNHIYRPIEGRRKQFKVLYTGAIGEANNLISLVRVAALLEEELSMCFEIIGDGPQKSTLLEEVQKRGLTNIKILPPVPKEEIPVILASADLLFFNLKDSPVFKFGISSNKLFDYMAAGRMILFSANASNNPIKESGGGETVNPNSTIELKDAIMKLFKLSLSEKNKLGENNRAYVEQNFAISHLVQSLENVLKEVCKNEKK